MSASAEPSPSDIVAWHLFCIKPLPKQMSSLSLKRRHKNGWLGVFQNSDFSLRENDR